jgi:hypothetical protein
MRVPSRSASVPWYGLASRMTGHGPLPWTAGSGRTTSVYRWTPSAICTSNDSRTVFGYAGWDRLGASAM